MELRMSELASTLDNKKVNKLHVRLTNGTRWDITRSEESQWTIKGGLPVPTVLSTFQAQQTNPEFPCVIVKSLNVQNVFEMNKVGVESCQPVLEDDPIRNARKERLLGPRFHKDEPTLLGTFPLDGASCYDWDALEAAIKEFSLRPSRPFETRPLSNSSMERYSHVDLNERMGEIHNVTTVQKGKILKVFGDVVFNEPGKEFIAKIDFDFGMRAITDVRPTKAGVIGHVSNIISFDLLPLQTTQPALTTRK